MSYGLYRVTPQGESWLGYNKGQVVSFGRDSSPVRFDFFNVSGQPAKFLVNGVIYFIGVNSQQSIKYLYWINNQLTLSEKSSGQFPGRVFIYLPPGQTYTPDNNLASAFYVLGNTISESRLIWSSITDQIYLGYDGTILSKDCQSNCAGKKCNEDNGCGLPCGCPNGECLSDGSCQSDRDSGVICPENTNCGAFNGHCYGNCPVGYQCIRDEKGQHGCQKIWSVYTNFYVGISLMILLVLVILIYLFWQYKIFS